MLNLGLDQCLESHLRRVAERIPESLRQAGRPGRPKFPFLILLCGKIRSQSSFINLYFDFTMLFSVPVFCRIIFIHNCEHWPGPALIYLNLRSCNDHVAYSCAGQRLQECNSPNNFFAVPNLGSLVLYYFELLMQYIKMALLTLIIFVFKNLFMSYRQRCVSAFF